MLIDSHCHVPHKKYGKTPEEIVKQAEEAGVTKLVTIGTSLKENEIVLKTAEKFANVYSAIGIYPHEDRNTDIQTLETELQKQINSSKKVRAVGECGLDITNWENQHPVPEQEEIFEMQINLAIKNKLPLVIHNRNGDKQVLRLLNKYKNTSLTAVLHCYVGNWETAQKFLDLGHYLSFTGIITYKSGKTIHETVINAPLDRIMVETDAPYLSPEPVRNMTNVPANVKITAQKVAALRNLEFAQVCEATYTNTCKFFGL